MSSSLRNLARGQLYSCPVSPGRLALCRGPLSVTCVNADAADHVVFPQGLKSEEPSAEGWGEVRNEIGEIIDFNLSSNRLIWNSGT